MSRQSLVLALSLLVAHSAIPQQPQDASGPSIEITAQWIVNNIIRAGGAYHTNNSVDQRYGNPQIHACTLTYTSDITIKSPAVLGGHVASWTEAVAIPLGSLSQITGGQGAKDAPSIVLRAPTEALTVAMSNVYDESGGFGLSAGTKSRSAIEIVFGVQGQDNEDLVLRMIKALTHARDLCKASYNSHPGEPF